MNISDAQMKRRAVRPVMWLYLLAFYGRPA